MKTSSGEASGERQRGQESAALVPQVTSAQVSAEVAVLPPERGDGAGRGPREAATPPGRRGRRLLSRWPRLPLLCRRQAVDLRHHLRDLILQPLSEKKDRRGGGASASLLPAQGGAASEVLPEPAGAGTPVPVTGPVRAARRRSRRVCARPPPRGARGAHAQGRAGTLGTPARCKGQSVPGRSRRPCARLPPASGRCVPGTTRPAGEVNAFRTGSPRPDHDRQRPRGRGDRRATPGPLHGHGEQEVCRPLPSALPGRRGLCFTDLDTPRAPFLRVAQCADARLSFFMSAPSHLIYYFT